MDLDSSWNEDFVLELPEEHDDEVDENDNYKYGEQAKIHQPVDSTLVDLDIDKKPCMKINIKSESNNVSRNNCQRQTTLSEYFSVLPPATPDVKYKRDDALDKMVNVSLLLNQLFNARVVLNRLPENIVKFQKPIGKTGVQRYCYKCKTLSIEHTSVIAQKTCSKCDVVLLYVCEKCNEKHYHTYTSLMRHRMRCKGDKTGESLEDVTLMYCDRCSFKTTYKYVMESHVKNNHKMLDKSKNRRKAVEPQCSIDFPIARKRYCPSCDIIANSNSTEDDDTCEICNTILLHQCSKCNQRYVNVKALYYHLKAKCYPSIYRCPECNYMASIWEQMHAHLKRGCDLPTSINRSKCIEPNSDTLMCEHCTFRSNYKHNLSRHLQRFHMGRI